MGREFKPWVPPCSGVRTNVRVLPRVVHGPTAHALRGLPRDTCAALCQPVCYRALAGQLQEPLAANRVQVRHHPLKKENLYYNNFVIPAGHMVPLSAETGGRFDGAFSNFLKEVVTSGLDFGESPVPVWTKETRALFVSRLRSAHVAT